MFSGGHVPMRPVLRASSSLAGVCRRSGSHQAPPRPPWDYGEGVLEPIITLPDGTIKQTNPFSGTQVWTVPGRAHRPHLDHDVVSEPIDRDADGRHCSFCQLRYLDSPPERTRLVGPDFVAIERVPAGQLDATVAEFRRVANLFPILPVAYWQANHGYRPDPRAKRWRRDYRADPAGRRHLLGLGRRLFSAAGWDHEQIELAGEDAQLAVCDTFFSSSHELVIARRHYADGAQSTAELAGSGAHTPEQHAAYLSLSVETARDLYSVIPQARYVTIFQNWLRPAGASFEHLHKQIAAIDQIPVQMQRELDRVNRDPDLYRRQGVDYASSKALVVASNDHAVAFAGYGHRYPSFEVHSLSAAGRPWQLSSEELRGMSDLIHAMHLASGVQTPCNEEWHYRPPGIEVAMPVRVVIKRRTATLAGFEGATKIYLTTLSPWAMREQAVETLRENRSRLGEVTIH